MGLIANNVVKADPPPAPVAAPAPVTVGPAIKAGNFVKAEKPTEPVAVGPMIKAGKFVKAEKPVANYKQFNGLPSSVKSGNFVVPDKLKPAPKPFKYADAPKVIPEKPKRKPKRTSTFMSHMTTK